MITKVEEKDAPLTRRSAMTLGSIIAVVYWREREEDNIK
jgi:hypothetical protein